MAKETEEMDLPPDVVQRGVAAVFADAGKGRYFVATSVVEPVASLAGGVKLEAIPSRVPPTLQSTLSPSGEGSNRPIVGCLLVTPEWSDWRAGTWWWIQSVYVVPEARGRGVYRALYEHVRGRVEEDPGLLGLRLYVDRGNRGAQAAYEQLGMSRDHYDQFFWQKGAGAPPT